MRTYYKHFKLVLLICWLLPSLNVQAQQLQVSGQVVDENGQGLPSATIHEKGTTNGTITDINGDYSISVTGEESTLVFSYIGYLTEEIAISGRSKIDITLLLDIQSLSEVIVIGYGTQEKQDVSSSVSSVSSEDIQELPVAGLDQALAGQAAGVRIIQTSGAPGGGVSVQVRGVGSITAGNEPLYVIDGFPVEGDFNQGANPLNTINPNDIADIQVLKDASATAIYGSRGSNGVVIITTKQGKPGKAKFNFEVFTGFQELARTIDLLDAQKFVEYGIEAHNNAWVDGDPENRSADDPNDTRRGPGKIPNVYLDYDPDSSANTNWVDELFRQAPMHSFQLSVSGGNENTRYRISGGYLDQRGILIGSGFKRYTARLNLESQLNDWMKVGVNLSPSFTNTDHVQATGQFWRDGIMQMMYQSSPLVPVRDENGELINSFEVSGIINQESPVRVATMIDDQRTLFRTLGTSFLDVTFLENFTFRTQFGLDYFANTREYFRPGDLGRGGQSPGTIPATAIAENGTRINWLSENTLTYDRRFADKHRVNVLIGYTAQKETRSNYSAEGTNFPNELVTTINAAGEQTATSSKAEWALMSYLARVQYDYKRKYYFTATVRRDGSSRFGTQNTFSVFPSTSVAWRVTEEPFMNNLPALSELKLRASYGVAGNNAIGNYASYGLLTSENYILGNGAGSIAPGLRPNTVQNAGITWESSRQVNLGVDIGLITNRFNLTVDYYKINNEDLLLTVNVPEITGVSTALQNIGEVENTGWELALNSVNFEGDFKWTTNFNIFFNRNKVIELGPEGDPIFAGASIGNTSITEVGEPLGMFYGYKIRKVIQNEEDLAAATAAGEVYGGNRATRVGDFWFVDTNQDSVLNATDRVPIGNPYPDYVLGFTNTFSYRGFDLRVIVDGTVGNEILNVSRLAPTDGRRNQFEFVTNRFQSTDNPGDGTEPRYNRTQTGNNFQRFSDYYLEDGSFIRIRNITLGYRLPANLLEKLRLNAARLYCSVQNAFYFSDYSNFNPETNTANEPQGNSLSSLSPGVDFGGYPLSRVYTLGANISF